jgi:transposase
MTIIRTFTTIEQQKEDCADMRLLKLMELIEIDGMPCKEIAKKWNVTIGRIYAMRTKFYEKRKSGVL